MRAAVAAALAGTFTQSATGQSSANFSLRISTLNAGIARTSSANFHLSSSLGDSFFLGPDASTNFRLTHGVFDAGAETPPPALVSAVSRKAHGSAGTFDLPLSLADVHSPTIEPRIGPAQVIVFTYDKAVTAATATITEGVATAGAPVFSGNAVIVALTGVNDQQYVTVSLSGVTSSDGGNGGSGSARIGFLLGDVNQNRVVSVADLALVNAQLAQAVTASNYLKDVNASGTLSVADKAVTNARLTKALPPP